MSTEAAGSQKVCSHCGGNEFYSSRAGFGGHTAGAIPLGFLASADCVVRICGRCGLVQWFVTPHSLTAVKRKYTLEGSGGAAGHKEAEEPDEEPWS